MKPMHQKTSRIFHLVLAISLFVILGGCDLPFGDNSPVEFAKDIILPEAPDGEAAPAEDRQVVVSSLEEELVILDYSKYRSSSKEIFTRTSTWGRDLHHQRLEN
jgi:hypothetical protein